MAYWQLRNRIMYDKLENAVKDLLTELRIDEKCLKVMATGYSPEYSGILEDDKKEGWNPCPKVQLSQIVAKKLKEALEEK